MLFKAMFKNGKSFHELVDTIGEFVPEGNFIADHTGLKFMGKETNLVAMAILNMPVSAFAEYECNAPLMMGVDFGHLTKITSRIQPKEGLLLTVENKGELVMKTIPEKKPSRTFSYKLIDVFHDEEQKAPNLPFEVIAKFPAFVLNGIISDVDAIKSSNDSQVVTVTAVPEGAQGDAKDAKNPEKAGLFFNSDSTYGSVHIPVTKDGDLITLEIRNNKKVVDILSLKYLQIITKACQMTDILSFSYSENFPVKIVFNLPLGGELTYLIAPRIESEGGS